MRLDRSSSLVFVVSILSLSALVGAQISPVQLGQGRDTPPPPTERRIPVGTSMISGIVVTSDTGRPIRGARVTVSGQARVNTAADSVSGLVPPPGRGATPTVNIGGVAGGVSGGVRIGGSGSPSGLSRAIITDATGEFSFPRLPAGQFTISVFQNQFLATNYGQRRPGGQGAIISLTDGQQLRLNVPLMRGAIITGTVIGPDGEPQRQAAVRGWRVDTSGGFKRLMSQGYGQTDDRGFYRMFGLQPGEYVVSATPNQSELFSSEGPGAQLTLIERAIVSGQVLPPTAPGFPSTVSIPIAPQPSPTNMISPSYLSTYAPSSMVPSGATKVTVTGEEERHGVDIVVQLTQASQIQGVVSTPLEQGVTVQVSLVSDDVSIDSPQGNSTRLDQNGKFTFRTLSPGKYTVFAQTVAAPPPMTLVNGQPVGPQPPPPVLTDAQKMWGKTQVSVAGEPLIDVSVALQPAKSISGVVVLDMAKPLDLSRARMSVTLNQAPSPQQVYLGGPLPQGVVGADGRFTITGVPPGRYILRAGGRVKSSMIAGQDTLDFPFEFTGERDVTDAVVTLTDQLSELTGTLTDSAGKPAVDYGIIVAASDSRYWVPGSRRIAITRPSVDGRYFINTLPPGSYQIAAVFDLEPGAQYDPEFLRSVARASVSVVIGEGGKVTQDLRVK